VQAFFNVRHQAAFFLFDLVSDQGAFINPSLRRAGAFLAMFFEMPASSTTLLTSFVGVGLFFGEPSPVLGFDDDASGGEFTVDASAFRVFDGASTAHQLSRSVAGCSEGLLHVASLAGECPACSAHVARD